MKALTQVQEVLRPKHPSKIGQKTCWTKENGAQKMHKKFPPSRPFLSALAEGTNRTVMVDPLSNPIPSVYTICGWCWCSMLETKWFIRWKCTCIWGFKRIYGHSVFLSLTMSWSISCKCLIFTLTTEIIITLVHYYVVKYGWNDCSECANNMKTGSGCKICVCWSCHDKTHKLICKVKVDTSTLPHLHYLCIFQTSVIIGHGCDIS